MGLAGIYSLTARVFRCPGLRILNNILPHGDAGATGAGTTGAGTTGAGATGAGATGAEATWEKWKIS